MTEFDTVTRIGTTYDTTFKITILNIQDGGPPPPWK